MLWEKELHYSVWKLTFVSFQTLNTKEDKDKSSESFVYPFQNFNALKIS